MSTTTSSVLFELLNQRVETLEELAVSHYSSGNSESAESMFRACIMLSVSALDAFMHAKAVEIYLDRIVNQSNSVQKIESYLGATAQTLSSPAAITEIRYRLSFKTLVEPERIDAAIEASGMDPAAVWKRIGIETGARESRLRNALQLQVDRRNQIAHEGDWDPVDVALRHISSSHSHDCRKCISTTVAGLASHWI